VTASDPTPHLTYGHTDPNQIELEGHTKRKNSLLGKASF
jgi:hypothetical protein